MKRITQYSLYTLGIVKQLETLQTNDPPGRYLLPLLFMSVTLTSWANDKENQESLTSSVRVAQQLIEHIDNQLGVMLKAGGKGIEELKPLEQGWVRAATNLKQTFETLLADELGKLPTFAVEPCGIFSSNALIENAENHFAESVRAQLPEHVVREFRESGKCLAFDAFTASGFHAFRALEFEARRYHMVLHGLAAPQDIELGPLNNDLRKVLETEQKAGKPSAELMDLELIVITLDRTRAILRNPLMHPELFLSKDLAMEVFDIAKNAITWMIRDAERRARGQIAPGKI